ncbi:hypothetical protein [Herbaspirillum sp. alder98]|uniref:hypothetical protein n=1 Tax=Herbaspirillum sp. alder98 TaxID=2913096 RepID=UPI001CD8C6CA|nr:hypothetical protein [Herbaspirillum sp. alder98]MCA1324789.1 hypothetical protein [Herbaspirillum sp. alder98]
MGHADGHHGKRALKEVTVQQLETAIAAALYKITAHKYHVDIKRFDLDLDHDSSLRDGAVIEMRVVDSGMAMVPSPNRFCIDVQQAACLQTTKEPGLADQAPGLMQVDAKS